jgi:hypothetical protein
MELLSVDLPYINILQCSWTNRCMNLHDSYSPTHYTWHSHFRWVGTCQVVTWWRCMNLHDSYCRWVGMTHESCCCVDCRHLSVVMLWVFVSGHTVLYIELGWKYVVVSAHAILQLQLYSAVYQHIVVSAHVLLVLDKFWF